MLLGSFWNSPGELVLSSGYEVVAILQQKNSSYAKISLQLVLPSLETFIVSADAEIAHFLLEGDESTKTRGAEKTENYHKFCYVTAGMFLSRVTRYIHCESIFLHRSGICIHENDVCRGSTIIIFQI